MWAELIVIPLAFSCGALSISSYLQNLAAPSSDKTVRKVYLFQIEINSLIS